MSNPLIEQITLQLVDTLGDITIANGYNQTVGTIHRPKTLQARTQLPFASWDMAITMGDTSANEDLDAMGNPPIIGITQQLMLDMVYRAPKSATDPIEAVLARFEADVRRTVMQDPQINGLACDCDMDEPEWWSQADDGVMGATVVLSVHYRFAENDPYQVPGGAQAYQYIFDGGTAATETYDDVIDGNGA